MKIATLTISEHTTTGKPFGTCTNYTSSIKLTQQSLNKLHNLSCCKRGRRTNKSANGDGESLTCFRQPFTYQRRFLLISNGHYFTKFVRAYINILFFLDSGRRGKLTVVIWQLLSPTVVAKLDC